MTFRAAALLVLLAGIAACNWGGYGYRQPCEPDAPPGTCCPVGSHEVVGTISWDIICTPDEVSCVDVGADAGACPEAGPDAH